jgi:hypothetical protein
VNRTLSPAAKAVTVREGLWSGAALLFCCADEPIAAIRINANAEMCLLAFRIRNLLSLIAGSPFFEPSLAMAKFRAVLCHSAEIFLSMFVRQAIVVCIDC